MLGQAWNLGLQDSTWHWAGWEAQFTVTGLEHGPTEAGLMLGRAGTHIHRVQPDD